MFFDFIFYDLIVCVPNLNAFTITDTELKLIANAAIIGDSKIPKIGKSKPAAIGTPITL